MQLPDYYTILRISPNADATAIQRAYRKRAAECHPDRGGSHVEMVAVNEAWVVLRNPDTRRQYDEARNNSTDGSANERAWQGTRQARDFAEQYPRNWDDFSTWLDRVSVDFRNAEYGVSKDFNVPFPTVKNSVSGFMFIVTGGLIGFIAAGAILGFEPSPEFPSYPKRFVVLFFGSVGAFLGKAIHLAIASQMANTNRPSPTSNANTTQQYRLFQCPNCGQRQRFPQVNNVLSATCPKCRTPFDVDPDRSGST